LASSNTQENAFPVIPCNTQREPNNVTAA
jgi:hypothetical protein